jgi:exodeoxyribonuclease VII large subunit
MQIILPDTNELYQTLDSIETQLTQTLSQKLYNKRQELEHLLASYSQHSVEKQLKQKQEEIKQLKEQFHQNMMFKIKSYKRDVESISMRFPHAIDSIVNHNQGQLNNLKRMLESNNPKLKTKSGFAQISKDNKVIDISELNR